MRLQFALLGIALSLSACGPLLAAETKLLSPASLHGTWRGDLEPPGLLHSNETPQHASQRSVIAFHASLRFDMTTREGRGTSYTYGDYTVQHSILSLHFGSNSLRDNFSGWFRYQMTRQQNTLTLHALGGYSSATLRLLPPARQKELLRKPLKKRPLNGG